MTKTPHILYILAILVAAAICLNFGALSAKQAAFKREGELCNFISKYRKTQMIGDSCHIFQSSQAERIR